MNHLYSHIGCALEKVISTMVANKLLFLPQNSTFIAMVNYYVSCGLFLFSDFILKLVISLVKSVLNSFLKEI